MTVGEQRFAQQEFAGMPQRLFRASPSRLRAWLDCPRRYRLQYLDRPAPDKRRQRAHTSVGNAVHHALRDWWDLPERAPAAGAGLVDRAWIDVEMQLSRETAAGAESRRVSLKT